jgi:hypothetical protein
MASTFAAAKRATDDWIAGPAALLDEIRRSAPGAAPSAATTTWCLLQLVHRAHSCGFKLDQTHYTSANGRRSRRTWLRLNETFTA